MTSPVNALAHTSVDSQRSLAPAPGVTPPQAGEPAHTFLSDALVSRGLVNQQAMDAALIASRAGRRYSEILVVNGDLSDDDLARTLADHHRIDHVDLDAFSIDLDTEALVSRDVARRLGALPVALLETGEGVVALHDPEALTSMAEMAKLIGREIRPVVASRSQVERHIAARASPRTGAAVPPAQQASPPFTRFVAEPETPVVAARTPPIAPSPPAVAADPSSIARERHFTSEQRAAAGDDHGHIAEERSRIAQRAEALARFRDEMAPAAASARGALAPDGTPQAPAVAHVTIPPDLPRQGTVGVAEPPSTALRELAQRLANAELRVREADERASVAERSAREAGERASSAEDRARSTHERASNAEEQARTALGRAAGAEEQARAAVERARAAETQAEGMSAAATAAHEALAQLAQARLVFDQTARASARKIESLSKELDAERAERRRLENEPQRHIWRTRTAADAPQSQVRSTTPAAASRSGRPPHRRRPRPR